MSPRLRRPPPPLRAAALLAWQLLAAAPPRPARAACGAGEYQPPGGNCTGCKTCLWPPQYRVTPCGAFTNTVCRDCPVASQSSSDNQATCACFANPTYFMVPTYDTFGVLQSCCQKNAIWDAGSAHGCKCGAGYFETTGPSSFTCTICPPGTYAGQSAAGSEAAKECSPCPPGTYAYAGYDYCRGCGGCGAGQYAYQLCNATQNRACTSCLVGTYSAGGSQFGPCPPCPTIVAAKCACGAESRKVPCHELPLKCAKVCGKKLACGHHTCEQTCHAGPCGGCPFEGVRTCPCGGEAPWFLGLLRRFSPCCNCMLSMNRLTHKPTSTSSPPPPSCSHHLP